jgi:hypothetical protein
MQSERMSDVDSMDARLTRALERKPAVAVPAGFAARVAGQMPVRNAVTVPPARYGRAAMWIGMAVLVVVLVVVTMHFHGRTMFGLALEWILCAELAGLAAWLSGVWKPMES